MVIGQLIVLGLIYLFIYFRFSLLDFKFPPDLQTSFLFLIKFVLELVIYFMRMPHECNHLHACQTQQTHQEWKEFHV